MRLNLFSISYAGFWGQHPLSLFEFFSKAAELGFSGVMVAGKRPHLSPLDVTDQTMSAVRDQLTNCGLTCDVIAGYTDLAGGAAIEVPHQELQIAYVESLAKIAAGVGARYVRIFTAYESPLVPLGNLWRTVVATLREMSDRAAVHGITIAVQNHHDVGLHTDALLELLYDVDRTNCRLGFDAWSPALRGEDVYEAAKKAAPYSVITTNADYIRLPRFAYHQNLVNYERLQPDLVRAVKFGEGFVNYEAFFRGLTEGGFRGIATYEMCSPIRGGGALSNLDSYALHYVRWMKEHGFGSGK